MAVLWHAQQAAVRHLMSVAKPILGMRCVQAPMAFAGFHGSTDESQLVQPPLAFSGRSRTHRLVEVGPAATSAFCTHLPAIGADGNCTLADLA